MIITMMALVGVDMYWRRLHKLTTELVSYSFAF
jgi:hypothetical protein